MSIEKKIGIVQEAVAEVRQTFQLSTIGSDGEPVSSEPSYQIAEPGFRPFRMGKATPDELQAELDRIIAEADAATPKVDLGLENSEALKKLLVQNGIGIDCSNYAYHAQSHIHAKLGIDPYSREVFRAGDEIRRLHATKPSWQPVDTAGLPRELTEHERKKLETAEWLDAEWIARIFGKDVPFIVGSGHMADLASSVATRPEHALPGDLLVFQKAGSAVISHLSVVEYVTSDEYSTTAMFSHAWHTRDFESGLREDVMTLNHASGLAEEASHKGLIDPARYIGHAFRRPASLAIAYSHSD